MNKFLKLILLTLALASLSLGAFAGCSDDSGKPTPGPSSVSVELNKDTLALDADKSETLTVQGADKVVWRSDNEAVAKVDAQGVVTGVNPGTCKIYAATEDGNYEDECVVTVTGYHMSENVFSGFTKVENNTYNGEINYEVDNSDEDVFAISYDRSKMTNVWTSMILWYDTALSPTSLELEFEVVQGAIPCVMLEFGGESSFKQYERIGVKSGVNTFSLNVTDLDLDGEGSWKAIYLELNNPCPIEGTIDEQKGETTIEFTTIKMVEGTRTAPAAPENAEVTDGIVYWDRVMAASEYEIEVDGVLLTDVSQRTRSAGDAPVMRRAYRPTDENAFTVGSHTAKIRSKNSAGVSAWKEFTFEVQDKTEDDSAAFKNITGHSNNQWNTSQNYYTSSEEADGSINLTFTAAASDEWSTYIFNFDTATIDATKLHIKVECVSGNLNKILYQVLAGTVVYQADIEFIDGVGEITVDVTNENLAASYGNVGLFLSKYATAGEEYCLKVIDVSLSK